MKIETLHKPTYDRTTNKIVAYLLPEPKAEDFETQTEFNTNYFNSSALVKAKTEWQSSKIEISVDDDKTIDFIENWVRSTTGSKIVESYLKRADLTPITDMIEVSEIDLCKHPNCKCDTKNIGCEIERTGYIAKLSQVDKVEDDLKFCENAHDVSVQNYMDACEKYHKLNKQNKDLESKLKELKEVADNVYYDFEELCKNTSLEYESLTKYKQLNDTKHIL